MKNLHPSTPAGRQHEVKTETSQSLEETRRGGNGDCGQVNQPQSQQESCGPIRFPGCYKWWPGARASTLINRYKKTLEDFTISSGVGRSSMFTRGTVVVTVVVHFTGGYRVAAPGSHKFCARFEPYVLAISFNAGGSFVNHKLSVDVPSWTTMNSFNDTQTMPALFLWKPPEIFYQSKTPTHATTSAAWSLSLRVRYTDVVGFREFCDLQPLGILASSKLCERRPTHLSPLPSTGAGSTIISMLSSALLARTPSYQYIHASKVRPQQRQQEA